MRKSTAIEIVISTLTTISVILISLQYINQLSSNYFGIILVFDGIVSIILIVDFYKRIKDSNQGYRYFIYHIYELPSLIPLFLFVLMDTDTTVNAGLKSLRIIQLFRFLHMLSRILRIFENINNRLLYVILLTIVTVISGAMIIYLIEAPVPGSKITTLGDAFWWAIVTITTVGYGDVYPITAEGRILASFIMIIGIAILSLLISTLGASFIEARMNKERKIEEMSIKSMIKDKIDKIEVLQNEEIIALLNMISTLHSEIKNGKNKSEIVCAKCNNINPQKALYCNACGSSVAKEKNNTDHSNIKKTMK